MAKRSNLDNSSTSVIEQPASVLVHKAMIDAQRLVETGSDRRHYTLPLHHSAPCETSTVDSKATSVAILSTRASNSGGRTDSIFQPSKNCNAAPQTRPWHGPIPQREIGRAHV